ncbi:MAG: polyribonucleotide nucleotidyltransferase [Ignavibacteriales bacterium]|nr:polyribonucleotide nucleotidyltransferase [Ignavibacteriales bacterium]
MIFKEIEIGGKKLSIETGRFAKQANGAVMVRYGDTMVLVTAVAEKEPKEGMDYFPLSVEYREKSSAAGKIPGGFFKREGRPSEKEILSARLIDRPIRPLFPDDFNNDTQVAAFIYSFDGENDPDVIAAVGASAALTISDIPFIAPIGEVRVGRINNEFIVNPTLSQLEESDMELVVAGTETSIMMVEGESKEISEGDLLAALRFAHTEIVKIVKMQNELREMCGISKMKVAKKEVNAELLNDVKVLVYDKSNEIVNTVLTKVERSQKNSDLLNETVEALKEKFPLEDLEKQVGEILHDIEKEQMRSMILEKGKRLDGRNTTQIRPITIELGVLARTHGSALFTRGETQSLGSLTLGTKRDEQIIDGLQEEYKKRFILHYNFPPFCVGETGRYGGVGRREVGHGNLAERSLKNILPPEEVFPYTVRLNSDILESNGSSSMASVCSGCLSLMDGGVPIKAMIAGIAMGLVLEGDKFTVLSDILGNEDHLGDMDFKVAGSANGITAFQMDIKIEGVSFEIMEKALQQAKEGRLNIIETMKNVISEPRASISQYAPILVFTTVPVDKIGMVIGPGGKNIQAIQKDFGVEIVIEEDGKVNIAGINHEMTRKAKEYIERMTEAPAEGKNYEGKVIKITDFGAFVEILPGVQGLLHISQVDIKRVDKVSDVLKEGEIIKVKLLKIENGKMSLSRKALMKPERKEEKKKESDEENKE